MAAGIAAVGTGVGLAIDAGQKSPIDTNLGAKNEKVYELKSELEAERLGKKIIEYMADEKDLEAEIDKIDKELKRQHDDGQELDEDLLKRVSELTEKLDRLRRTIDSMIKDEAKLLKRHEEPPIEKEEEIVPENIPDTTPKGPLGTSLHKEI